MRSENSINRLMISLRKSRSKPMNFNKSVIEKIRFTFNSQQENRIFGLDLLRAGAILLVLFSHGFDPFLSEYFPRLRSLIFMDGVDLFFIISGFLIGSILLRQFDFHDNYSLKIIFSFWKRRWLRTLPIYYFIFLIILFVPVILPSIRGYNMAISFSIWGEYLLFSQNFFKVKTEFFSEAWSLAIEEWFYLITPIVLFSFHLLFKNILTKRLIFLIMMISIIVTCTIYRYKIGVNLSGNIKDWDTNIRRVVITRLDSIMFGVLGAYFKFYFPKHWKNKSLFPYLNSVCIFLLFTTHFLYIKAIDNNTHIFMNTFYFSFTGIAVIMILPQMDLLKSPPKFGIAGSMGKIITHISLISYSLYLTHGYLILGHIVRYRNEYFGKIIPNIPVTGILYFVLYFLVSVIVSTCLYYFIEKPIMNMRSKEL